MNGTERSLNVSYKWGTLEPIISIEQLVLNEGDLIWKSVENMTHGVDDSGYVKIIPKEPEAGTYRIKIIWSDNEMILYQKEIPFFIQYGAINQGGNGQ